MDQNSLVEHQIDDGMKVVEKLRESGFDVVAAWWMKPAEEGHWFLYIASKDVDQKGIAASYRMLHTAMLGLGQLWVDRFEVRLVGSEKAITKHVLEIQSKYPGRLATRYGGTRLGNVAIYDSYIYPAVVTT